MTLLRIPLAAGLVVLAVAACRPADPADPLAPADRVTTHAPPPGTYQLIVDEIRDLGRLPGHDWSEAHDINRYGRAAGTSKSSASPGGARAVHWPSGWTSPTSLGTLGGPSDAWGIDDQNQIVGTSTGANAIDRGFRWNQASGMKDLGLLGRIPALGIYPVESFGARAINNQGQIVGWLSANKAPVQAYQLDPSGTMTVVRPCTRVNQNYIEDINDTGQVVGQASCFGDYGYIGTLSGYTTIAPPRSLAASALGLNAAGTVVGWTAAQGKRHAFRWSNGVAVDLHPTYDTTNSQAEDINNSELVVGFRQWNGGAGVRAFVQGRGIPMTSLPGLCQGKIPDGSRAYAVNDSDWIVGGSLTCAGEYHATLWRIRVVFQKPLGDQPPDPPKLPPPVCGDVPCD